MKNYEIRTHNTKLSVGPTLFVSGRVQAWERADLQQGCPPEGEPIDLLHVEPLRGLPDRQAPIKRVDQARGHEQDHLEA